VLRRVSESVAKVRATETGNARAFLDLLGRVIQSKDDHAGPEAAAAPDEPRLIVP
jgi:hypothetical protein